jgi:signal-transduction protein with cAMP-binding, CBS, and nucleotidyltransferase domain
MKCPACGYNNLPGEEVCESCSMPIAELSLPQPEPGLKEKILTGTIADLKPHPAFSVAPNSSVREAVNLMREKQVGCVLVTESDKLIGMLTERHLLFHVAGLKDPSKTRVREIMYKDPACLNPSHPVSFAFHQMALGGYRHLPVALDDRSFAMVSSRDLLAYLKN